jgi:nicotinic acid mononucleotide adenylyltransferase
MLDIASRELRERLRSGAPSRYQVREEVWAYIEENGLYRSSEFGVRSSE